MLVVGDVSGHGFGPSLVMAETRAALRTMAATTNDVAAIVHRLNELVHDDDLNWFVTLFLAHIDTETRVCSYVSAGHPSVRFLSGGRPEVLESGEPPLGIRLNIEYQIRQLTLDAGDTLLLVTDGISERSSTAQQEFGMPRIHQSILSSANQPAAAMVDRLFDDANRFGQDTDASDDMTAIVLKVL